MNFKEYVSGTSQEKKAREKFKSLKKVENLSKKQELILDTSRTISRRVLLRQLGVLGAGVTFGGGGYLAKELIKDPEEESIPSWLTIEGEDTIGAERVKEAIKAVKDWDKNYHVGRSVKITSLNVLEQEKLANGQIATTLEIAEPGLIKLGNEESAYGIVLHAMTHASKPDEPTLLDIPLHLSDGAIVRGFHGLGVLAGLPNGEESQFTKFEEGMAERNASIISGYSVPDPRYFAVGNLSRNYFPQNKYPKAHNWAKTNDVPALVRIRLGLPTETVITAQMLEAVMGEYQNAWDNALPTN